MGELNEPNFNKLILNQLEKESLQKVISVIDDVVDKWMKRYRLNFGEKLEKLDMFGATKQAGIDVSENFFSEPGVRFENELNIKNSEIDICVEAIQKIDGADSLLKKLKLVSNDENWSSFLFSLEDDINEGWNSWEETEKPNLIRLLN